MKFGKFILFSFVLLAFCAINFGQTERSDDNISIIERELDEFSTIDFLKPQRLDRFVLEIFHNVPAGIVYAFGEETREETNVFQPQSLVLRDILDSFVKVKTEYSWSETNGVINVYPKNDYSMLDIYIAEFKVENEFPENMDEKLVQTAEFQQYLKGKNLIDRVPDSEKFGFIFQGGAGRRKVRDKISIDLKNVTVREILNEVVRLRGHSFWSYREFDYTTEGETYHMYRLEL